MSWEEYAHLSDQKADDWRSITEVTPTLFGVAGAIFGAGIASSSALVLAIAPLPLFLGIFHMVRNAKLQLQQIAFLAVRSSEGQWEKESTSVRNKVYDAMEGDTRWLRTTWSLRRPSSWNTWLVIAVVTTVLVNLTATMARYHSWGAGLAIGLGGASLATICLLWQISTIERDRDVWIAAWEAQEAGTDVGAAARVALGRRT